MPDDVSLCQAAKRFLDRSAGPQKRQKIYVMWITERIFDLSHIADANVTPKGHQD